MVKSNILMKRREEKRREEKRREEKRREEKKENVSYRLVFKLDNLGYLN